MRLYLSRFNCDCRNDTNVSSSNYYDFFTSVIRWYLYVASQTVGLSYSKLLYVVLQIIEFNDVNDTALIDTADAANINVLHLEYFNWQRVSLTQNSDFVYLNMEGNSYHDTAKNISRYGSIKLSVKYFAALKRKNVGST